MNRSRLSCGYLACLFMTPASHRSEPPSKPERFSLHKGFSAAWTDGRLEPLLVLAAYVFDFLCIHPFLDGNGRLSRLLTLLLLYQAGYGVGRFISLERIIEDTRESYYDALARSSEGWHEGRHTLVPWWEYLLGVVLLTAYREFEGRVGKIVGGRGAQSRLVMEAIERLTAPFRVRDIERLAPGVSRPTFLAAVAADHQPRLAEPPQRGKNPPAEQGPGCRLGARGVDPSARLRAE